MFSYAFAIVVAAILVVSTQTAPARAEQVPEAKLREFAAVMPGAPAGYTRNPQVGTYSSSSASSVTATYQSGDGSKSFSVVVTFSASIAKQNKDLLTNKTQRETTYGMTVEKIKGRDVLVRKPENKNKYIALYLVVLDDARMLSMTDLTGTADPAVVRAVLESVDFEAIAKK